MFLPVLFGLPLLLAVAPGFVALARRRWVLGVALVLGAIVAIFLPEYLDSLRIKQLLAQGVVADDLVFLFLPWIYGIPYALAATIVLAVWMTLRKARPKQV